MAIGVRAVCIVLFPIFYFASFAFANLINISGGEIIPLYFLPILCLAVNQWNVSRTFTIFCCLLLIFFLICSIFSLELGLRLAQLSIVAVSAIILGHLGFADRVVISKLFLLLLLVSLVVCVAQYFFKEFHDLSHIIFTVRGDSADALLAYTGGVIGVASEPSYMAALVVTAFIFCFFHFTTRLKVLSGLSVVLILFLLKSVTGYIYLVVFGLLVTVSGSWSARLVMLCGAISFLYFSDAFLVERLERFLVATLNLEISASRVWFLIEGLLHPDLGCIFKLECGTSKGFSLLAEVGFLLNPVQLIILFWLFILAVLYRSILIVIALVWGLIGSPVLLFLPLSLVFMRLKASRRGSRLSVFNQFAKRN